MGVANCFIPLGVYFGDFPFWNKARNAYILYVWMRLAGRIAHKITQKRVDESLNRDFFLFGRGGGRSESDDIACYPPGEE